MATTDSQEKPSFSRRFLLVLLAVLTLVAAYGATILIVIAAGAPLNDGQRNRFSEWTMAIVAGIVSVTLGVGTWHGWRASTRHQPEHSGRHLLTPDQ